MNRFLSLLMAAALLFTAAIASSAQVYRWVDKTGHVHYSQTPPAGTDAAAAPTTMIAAPAPDPTGLKNTQNLEATTSAQQKAADEAAQKAQAEAAKKAEHDKACADARKQLADMQTVRKVTLTDKNGQPQTYSGDDLLKQEQDLQDSINKNCSGG